MFLLWVFYNEFLFCQWLTCKTSSAKLCLFFCCFPYANPKRRQRQQVKQSCYLHLGLTQRFLYQLCPLYPHTHLYVIHIRYASTQRLIMFPSLWLGFGRFWVFNLLLAVFDDGCVFEEPWTIAIRVWEAGKLNTYVLNSCCCLLHVFSGGKERFFRLICTWHSVGHTTRRCGYRAVHLYTHSRGLRVWVSWFQFVPVI